MSIIITTKQRLNGFLPAIGGVGLELTVIFFSKKKSACSADEPPASVSERRAHLASKIGATPQRYRCYLLPLLRDHSKDQRLPFVMRLMMQGHFEPNRKGHGRRQGKTSKASSCLDTGHWFLRSQSPFFVTKRPSVLLRPPKKTIFRIFILLRTNTDNSNEIIKAIIAVDIIFVGPVPNP